MSSYLIITGQTGGTTPYTFYVCDEYGNNCQNVGTTGGTITLTPFFQTAGTLMVKTIDSAGCEFFEIVSCPKPTPTPTPTFTPTPTPTFTPTPTVSPTPTSTPTPAPTKG